MMFETEEYEKIITKMMNAGQLQDVYNLSKSLYTYEFASEKLRMTYGQCLVLSRENELAFKVFEKLYEEGYINYSILANLLFICFENYDFESVFYYLNELKKFCNKNQLRQLVPFEIYLYNVLGFDSTSICKTLSALYLKGQIESYSKQKAIDFIKTKNNYGYLRFNNETNIDELFYGALDYTVKTERGLQFNPFGFYINFFDKYYIETNKYSLAECPYRYAEVSSLPFSNHICMIAPSKTDKTLKKLTI